MEKGLRLTAILVLDNGVHRLEQRLQKRVVCLICKEKAGRRHGRKQLKQFKACLRSYLLQIWGNVVDSRKERRVYGIQLAFAGGNKVVDGLSVISMGLYGFQVSALL